MSENKPLEITVKDTTIKNEENKVEAPKEPEEKKEE